MVLSEKQKKLAVVLTLALSVFIVDRAFLADSLTGPQEAVADVGEAVEVLAAEEQTQMQSDSIAPAQALAQRLESLARANQAVLSSSRDAFVPSALWIGKIDGKPAQVGQAQARAREFLTAHRLNTVMGKASSGTIIVDDNTIIQVGQKLDGFRLIRLGNRSATFKLEDVRVMLALEK